MSWSEFNESLHKFYDLIQQHEVKTSDDFCKFKDNHPLLMQIIILGSDFFPHPINQIVKNIFDKSDDKIEGAQNVLEYLQKIEQCGEQNFSQVFEMLNNIIGIMAKEDTLLLVKDLLVSQGNDRDIIFNSLIKNQQQIAELKDIMESFIRNNEKNNSNYSKTIEDNVSKVLLSDYELIKNALDGDEKQAWKEWCKILSDDKALATLINVAFTFEDYEKVVAYCNLLLKLKPDDSFALNRKGLANGYLGKDLDAMEVFERMASLYPDQVMTWWNKGMMLWKNNRKEEAKVCFAKFRKISGWKKPSKDVA